MFGFIACGFLRCEFNSSVSVIIVFVLLLHLLLIYVGLCGFTVVLGKCGWILFWVWYCLFRWLFCCLLLVRWFLRVCFTVSVLVGLILRVWLAVVGIVVLVGDLVLFCCFCLHYTSWFGFVFDVFCGFILLLFDFFVTLLIGWYLICFVDVVWVCWFWVGWWVYCLMVISRLFWIVLL